MTQNDRTYPSLKHKVTYRLCSKNIANPHTHPLSKKRIYCYHLLDGMLTGLTTLQHFVRLTSQCCTVYFRDTKEHCERYLCCPRTNTMTLAREWTQSTQSRETSMHNLVSLHSKRCIVQRVWIPQAKMQVFRNWLTVTLLRSKSAFPSKVLSE